MSGAKNGPLRARSVSNRNRLRESKARSAASHGGKESAVAKKCQHIEERIRSSGSKAAYIGGTRMRVSTMARMYDTEAMIKWITSEIEDDARLAEAAVAR